MAMEVQTGKFTGYFLREVTLNPNLLGSIPFAYRTYKERGLFSKKHLEAAGSAIICLYIVAIFSAFTESVNLVKDLGAIAINIVGANHSPL